MKFKTKQKIYKVLRQNLTKNAAECLSWVQDTYGEKLQKFSERHLKRPNKCRHILYSDLENSIIKKKFLLKSICTLSIISI